MTRDQQQPSIDEQHATTDQSRSRRGFLKKAAATGILGMTVTIEAASATEPTATMASESASATETTEPSGDVSIQKKRNRVTITGTSILRTKYRFYRTGDVYGDDELDIIQKIPEGKQMDDSRTYYCQVDGIVNVTKSDVFFFYGYVYILPNGRINSSVDDL